GSYWIVPGGQVTFEVGWRLIQRLEVVDPGLFPNHPQSWRDPRNRHAPDGQVWAKTLKEIYTMDVRDFLGPPRFVKFGDHPNPRRASVEGVAPNRKYEGKLDMAIEYTDGSRGVVSLNVGNLTALVKHWGADSDAWLGLEVELSDGQVAFGNGH